MAKTQAQVTAWAKEFYDKKYLYVWGMNGEEITASVIAAALRNFKTSKYNETYYNDKLAAGTGKRGADCSGLFCQMSGFDNTAQGYYNGCTVKGAIANIPTNQACLVFSGGSTSSIDHIGWYCGDGYVIEMRSSTLNCTKTLLSKRSFKWYGLPSWISDYGKVTTSSVTVTPEVIYGGSQYIKLYQTYLNEHYSTGLKVDGEYGPLTKGASVKALRSLMGLTVSTALDNTLISAFIDNNLIRGDTGELVYILQGLLYCHGFDPKGFDGKFGPGCQAAVKAYQKSKNIKVDGKVGTQTWSALAA